MVARPPCRRRLDPFKAQPPKTKRVHERLDRPDRVLLAHPVVEKLRQQHPLPTILTLNEALHRPALSRVDGEP
jgi:hypothetical protein